MLSLEKCLLVLKQIGIYYIEIEEVIIFENYRGEGRSTQNYISLGML